MIGHGTVTLNGRMVATGVLIQIRRDTDSTGWHGTLFFSGGRLAEGKFLWSRSRYGLELDGGSSGEFVVTTPERIGAATVEVQGSGPLRPATAEV